MKPRATTLAVVSGPPGLWPDKARGLSGDPAWRRTDPSFRDPPLFYEYWHGDTSRGVGAAPQTGWTGLIAKLLQPRP